MSKAELNCKWHFAEQLGGRDDGPNDPMDVSFKRNPYASLVRESIQNSLDVPLDINQPVRVVFSFGKIRVHDYPNFFALKKHIEGCINYYPTNTNAETTYRPMIESLQEADEEISYIKVSDYNTQGMEYAKNKTDSPFYAFVRAAGVSAKKDVEAGGSFGFGKAAYFYISSIRTVLVYTHTKNDKVFFEGASSLCTHILDKDKEKKYVSVGYYDNNDGEPVTKKEKIPTRFGKRDEPGTDIFIVGINAAKEEIMEEMTRATLQNFWMAIYCNKLEVKIGDEVICKDNIAEIMETYFPDELDTKNNEKNYNPRPYLDAVMNANRDSNHVCFEDKFNNVIGKVKFYAVKNPKAQDKILYMRKPLMLVYAQRTQSSNGFYGVFICEDSLGNKYLRNTENPAHNEWKSTNWRENGKINPVGRNAIKSVENYIKLVIERLFPLKDKKIQKIQGLEEFLYIPTAIDNDENDNESFVGDIVRLKETEGNSPTTDLSDIHKKTTPKPIVIGKVLISNTKNVNYTPDKNGDTLGGHGTKPINNPGGGGMSTKNIEGHYGESEEGLSGSFLKEIPVSYRSFAQMENGRVIHMIIIHSDYDFENGRIDLLVGGDQSDDEIPVLCCEPQGIINGNTISGLKLVKSSNTLKIKFADNMKHAIKLDAYEVE